MHPPPSPASAALAIAVLIVAAAPCLAQTPAALKDISRAPSGDILLHAAPQVPGPDALLLQSSDSPAGPWWTVPGQQRSTVTGGYQFLAPFKSWQPRQFYRLGTVDQDSTEPRISFVAPNERVLPGQSITLLGRNFSASPAGNTVTFSLPTQTWPATVAAASERHLTVTVPPGLVFSKLKQDLLYRITVTTAAGTSNGVGCKVQDAVLPAFAMRPAEATILLPPGSGRTSLVIGGGVPPYTLTPQPPAQAAIATAVLNGSILDVTAPGASPGGIIQVKVTDSSEPPFESSSYVVVQPVEFFPDMFVQFHTTLERSAPGCTLQLSLPGSSLLVEQTEVRFQGVTLEPGGLEPGSIPALMQYGSSFSAEKLFAHLEVTSVEPGRAHFEVVRITEDDREVLGTGTINANPPAIVIRSADAAPAKVLAAGVDQELLLSDGIIRLPAGTGTPFSVTAVVTSVSSHSERYAPEQVSRTQNFLTTASAGPRLEKVWPVQAQTSARVKLFGTGMGVDSTVTFTGANGPVPAVVRERTAQGLTVVVPNGADTAGPIRVTSGGQTSNGFHFLPRFHPDAVLLFDTFTANTAAPMHLLFQQLPDTSDQEARIGRIVWTLDSGTFDFSSLDVDDEAGAIAVVSQTSAFEDSLSIWYTGPEAGTSRHVFDSLFTRFYLSNAPGGAGVVIELEQLEKVRTDLVWDCHFTTALYRPPSAGTQVNTRMEIISEQWCSPVVAPLNVIKNLSQPVQP